MCFLLQVNTILLFSIYMLSSKQRPKVVYALCMNQRFISLDLLAYSEICSSFFGPLESYHSLSYLPQRISVSFSKWMHSVQFLPYLVVLKTVMVYISFAPSLSCCIFQVELIFTLPWTNIHCCTFKVDGERVPLEIAEGQSTISFLKVFQMQYMKTKII